MDVKEIRKRIVDFSTKRASKVGFTLTPETAFIHLTEEVGEIARQLSNKKIRKELYDKQNLKEEVVDVILEALLLSHLLNVDLDSEIDNKLKALYKKHGLSYE